MTCQRCGSWQANVDNRYCSNCGATLAYPNYDDTTLADTGLRYDLAPGVPPQAPPPAPPRRDQRDWLRHPGTWAIAATALLVAGIVLAAVILAGGSKDRSNPVAAADRRTEAARTPTPTATTAPPTATQTVVVVPAAPGSPAETRTVTVGPAPSQDAGAANQTFAGATSVSPSYYQRGSTVYFDSPSGNIGCRLVAYGSQAQCTIKDYDFSAPGYDCPHGAGVLMNSGGSPSIDCVNDPYSGESALDFGESVAFGDFTCVSRSNGITCLDSYGSGFLMGRKAYTEY